ncbi:MAG: hypothetical protein JWO57_523 [Pseudonocardiales bacterium]|nr:hypothetical protein [Pseudonocardiales bacterium]
MPESAVPTDRLRRLRRVGRVGTAATACAAAVAGLVLAASPARANPPGPHDPIGHLDSLVSPAAGQLRAGGWAADPDAITRPVTVLGLVDGRVVASAVTAGRRPDVVRLIHTGPTPGFSLILPVPASGTHTACIAVRNVGGGTDRVLGCVATPLGTALSRSQLATHDPIGALDTVAATSGTVRAAGWASEPDDLGRPVTVVLYVDGASAATVAATQTRPDVARRRGTSSRVGYGITVTTRPGAHVACMWAVNVGFGGNSLLGCRVVDSRGPAGTAAIGTPAANNRVVAEANRHLGQPYVWGAAGPKAFDCSGLVLYSYRVAGLTTPRVAADQFTAARLIPAARAKPGDLVFYHDTVGYVYHVGIYLGNGMTDAAVDPANGVRHQAVTDPMATYGSFTHI